MARWYAHARNVYAHQGTGRDRLRNDPHICSCRSTADAQRIADLNNTDLMSATRIVPRKRATS
jgi:hypothetical protein